MHLATPSQVIWVVSVGNWFNFRSLHIVHDYHIFVHTFTCIDVWLYAGNAWKVSDFNITTSFAHGLVSLLCSETRSGERHELLVPSFVFLVHPFQKPASLQSHYSIMVPLITNGCPKMIWRQFASTYSQTHTIQIWKLEAYTQKRYVSGRFLRRFLSRFHCEPTQLAHCFKTFWKISASAGSPWTRSHMVTWGQVDG